MRAPDPERGLSLCLARTLKMQPQERQAHETRRRTGYAEVTPRKVEKTYGGHLTGTWTPRATLSAYPERCRGLNSTRAFHPALRRLEAFRWLCPEGEDNLTRVAGIGFGFSRPGLADIREGFLKSAAGAGEPNSLLLALPLRPVKESNPLRVDLRR
jgi:hypothetical protein